MKSNRQGRADMAPGLWCEQVFMWVSRPLLGSLGRSLRDLLSGTRGRDVWVKVLRWRVTFFPLPGSSWELSTSLQKPWTRSSWKTQTLSSRWVWGPRAVLGVPGRPAPASQADCSLRHIPELSQRYACVSAGFHRVVVMGRELLRARNQALD